jgi:signal transduction histidine kinase
VLAAWLWPLPATAMTPYTLQPIRACVTLAGSADCSAITPALPFRWDLAYIRVDGSARFEFEFERGAQDRSLSLLLPRAGNGVEVELNGETLFGIGAAGSQRHDAVKRPWLVPLPSDALRGHNHLVVTIHAAAGRAAQLQAPRLGPHDAMRAEYDRHYLWRVEITRALMWMSAMLGLMSLIVWLIQRETLFIACAVAELAWAVRLSEMFWIEMPLGWQIWGTGVATVFGVMQMAMAYFFLHAVGRWNAFFRRAYAVFVAVWCLVVPLVAIARWRDLWVGWLLSSTAMFLLLAVFVGVHAFAERHFWRWLFAAWVGASVAAGIADIQESAGSMYSHPTWSRLVTAAFSLAMVLLVARRLQRARAAEQAQASRMRVALANQQAELQALHVEQGRVQVEMAMREERERMMRDMHDGLGAQLSGLLSLAGQPAVAPAQLQGEVRAAIDELRLVVEAMTPFDGNIATMLGSMRPQLERRLALAQIGLRWAVDDLPPADGYTPARVQHLRRLLLEAATNIARHSGATMAEMSARLRSGVLELSLTDDGRGFDGDAGHAGNGLRNMRWRAKALGGELAYGSPKGGRVMLRIPLVATPVVPP